MAVVMVAIAIYPQSHVAPNPQALDFVEPAAELPAVAFGS
jgi:hypothetical protein